MKTIETKYGAQIFRGVEALGVDILDMDSSNIKYRVSGVPVCEYDQHSRARIGAKFSSYQVNPMPIYIFYTSLFDSLQAKINNEADSLQTEINNEAFATFTIFESSYYKLSQTLLELEHLRNETSIPETYTLMSRECSYVVDQTRQSMFGQMMRRLKFCEEEFIVGLHWLLKNKIKAEAEKRDLQDWLKDTEKYLPGCDHIKKCDYSSADYLSNMFGCLFSGCGRWPMETEFATFNQSCTTPELLEEQLNIHELSIERSEHEIAR